MPNQLIHEKSPYLLQHAHNPVDWLPWGEGAFQKARAEDKPIFLSVGYSTCHWCHVMEHESFEDVTIAAILNREFIPVKVDREERPDVDRIYMSYVQAATGSGGWPMSVWLTPDLHPFVGGTYFPPDDRYGRPGFASVCIRIAQAWRNERERIGSSSLKVLEQLRGVSGVAVNLGEPEPQSLRRTFDYFRRTYDSLYGGFGSAPKFPRPAIFQFLLRYWAETKEQDALDMVTSTLRAMANGGMNDQLGGGFHRYSVDAEWFVPHFEKMLYDQAQLAIAYLEAFQITGEPLFRDELRRILGYVLRDLTSPEGGFYCAEDADSAPDAANPKHKSEGAFYIWTDGELGDRFFSYQYGSLPGGNVENDPHGEFTGRNILYRAHTTAETAHYFDVNEEDVARSIEATKSRLLNERSRRPRPHLDDKVLTGWNGMMIGAFARAGAVLDEPVYLNAAKRAAAFIESKLIVEGRLMRRYRDGSAAVPAFLDDYANFVQGLLELYQCALEPAYLDVAVRLTEQQQEAFEDPEGGFYSTASGATDLVLRLKDDYDGAEPGANSVTAVNLLLLGRFTEDPKYTETAQNIFRAFSSQINQSGPSVPLLVAAYQMSLQPPVDVRLSGKSSSPEARPFLRAYWDKFRPFGAIVPDSIDGPVAATVCRNFVCQLPTKDPEEFSRLLQ